MSQSIAPDVRKVIQNQHRAIRRLLAEISQASPNARHVAFEKLAQLLAVHEAAERDIVYPAIRGNGQSTAHVVSEREDEESATRHAITDLQRLDAASDDFELAFEAFRSAVEAHAAREEAFVFPRLARAYSDCLGLMGQAFLAATDLRHIDHARMKADA